MVFTRNERYDVDAAIVDSPTGPLSPASYLTSETRRIAVDGELEITGVYPDDSAP